MSSCRVECPMFNRDFSVLVVEECSGRFCF
jgi:hypothetical protein